MEIKLKINTDKILAETGITIDEPEQWLALMQDGLDSSIHQSKPLFRLFNRDSSLGKDFVGIDFQFDFHS